MAATERLRELLDERGVEWEAFDVFEQTTHWSTHNGAFVYWARERDGKLLVETTVPTKCSASCTPEQAVEATLGPRTTGETSDGFHTMAELYHHRAVLFSVIVRDHAELAWKSKLHSDGTMYDGMFIVGIQTSQGQATYHYDIEPYWEMFDCRELERAPEWDGHTPEQAIERIATLGAGTCRTVYLVEISDDLLESWYTIAVYQCREAAESRAEALRREVDGVRHFARVSKLKVVDA